MNNMCFFVSGDKQPAIYFLWIWICEQWKFIQGNISFKNKILQMSKGGKFLKKLWCCVGGGV